MGPRGKELVTGSHKGEGDRIWQGQELETLRATEIVEGETQERTWSLEARRKTLAAKDCTEALGGEQLGRERGQRRGSEGSQILPIWCQMLLLSNTTQSNMSLFRQRNRDKKGLGTGEDQE